MWNILQFDGNIYVCRLQRERPARVDSQLKTDVAKQKLNIVRIRRPRSGGGSSSSAAAAPATVQENCAAAAATKRTTKCTTAIASRLSHTNTRRCPNEHAPERTHTHTREHAYTHNNTYAHSGSGWQQWKGKAKTKKKVWIRPTDNCCCCWLLADAARCMCVSELAFVNLCLCAYIASCLGHAR